MTWVSWSLLTEPSLLQTLCTNLDLHFRAIHSHCWMRKAVPFNTVSAAYTGKRARHENCALSFHRPELFTLQMPSFCQGLFSYFIKHQLWLFTFSASFPLIFFGLTDLSHTQDKAWTDLSLCKFASYLLTHVQLNLCKVRNFCLLHSADW